MRLYEGAIACVHPRKRGGGDGGEDGMAFGGSVDSMFCDNMLMLMVSVGEF